MESSFIRKPNGLESFFIDLDAGGSNMTIHFYLELDRKPNVHRLRKAFEQTLRIDKGMDMRFYKNAWYTVTIPHECPVIDVEGYDLEKYVPSHLDYTKSTIDIKVLHATLSNTWYLCFDFFHGVSDGRSCVQFIYDFFDVLNKRRIRDPEFSMNVAEIIPKHSESKKGKIHQAFSIISKCAPSQWHVKTEGRDKTVVLRHESTLRGISAHYAGVVSTLFKNKSAKMIIPVDIRRYSDRKDKSLYGNIFAPMFFDAAKHPKWQDAYDAIWKFAKHQHTLRRLLRKLNLYARIPVRLRQFVIRKAVPFVMSRKNFIFCALVSSLGNIESQRLITQDFSVRDVSATFISFPFAAFSVISLQYEGHTKTTISWHSKRVPKQAVNSLIEGINECMEKQAIKA